MHLKVILLLLLFFPAFINSSPGLNVPGKPEQNNYRSTMNLSGCWKFALDPAGTGINKKWFLNNFSDSVYLPGTTDTNKKGILNKDTTTLHLNRIYKYEGAAWYQREIIIDSAWKQNNIQLVLERTKCSRIWIDGNFIGESKLLQSPQKFTVSEYLFPGKHTITIMIDNSLSLTPYGNVHIYSDDTQTNWNGMIGNIYLEATQKTFITAIRVYPDIINKRFSAAISIKNELKLDKINLTLNISEELNGNVKALKSKTYNLKCDSILMIEYELGENMKLWDEYTQPLYKIDIMISNDIDIRDSKTVSFGMREFKPEGTQFKINGRVTFLRGKHDACVFPLTGYSPMDTTDWMRVFRVAKLYGINHYRFHSYCPPEAAFEAADRLGIYIQAELPFWGGLESDTVAENLTAEGLAMLESYANHPSFVLFSPGNEIWSGHERVAKIMSFLKEKDKRVLYTQGSNNNIGYNEPASYEDFHVAVRTPFAYDTTLTHLRLTHAFVDSKDGGILNTQYPSTKVNFDYPVFQIKMPLISHEMGQYQVYPDYDEIIKYTGVLKPWNLEVFRNKLKQSGMFSLNKDFAKASGALAAICYKAEIEAALRTKGLAGFQLLDLQDFPGQGTALVGILDAFMDSKNIISNKEWSQFCNDVVPLMEFEKYCWTSSEIFKADLKAANYSNTNLKQDIIWEMINEEGKVLHTDTIKNRVIPYGGLSAIETIELALSKFSAPSKMRINISITNTTYCNSYDIWIYPAEVMPEAGTIIITEILNHDIITKMNKGEKVLLFPSAESVKSNSLPGMFIPDFWNYGMFKGISEWAKKPVSPGTMGLLMNPEHPLFDNFPTDFHSNWQWWSIVKNSNPLILDSAETKYVPIVQVIDNLQRNHKIGLISEFRVGKGKLLVCMSDLREIKDKPEAIQLYRSILKYMESDKFNPQQSADKKMLKNILK